MVRPAQDVVYVCLLFMLTCISCATNARELQEVHCRWPVKETLLCTVEGDVVLHTGTSHISPHSVKSLHMCHAMDATGGLACDSTEMHHQMSQRISLTDSIIVHSICQFDA